MASARVQEERVGRLNDVEKPRDGDYVLYWMQQSQRAGDNHALEYAVQRANDTERRLLVAFGLTDDYPEANLRHYAFMLEGLKDVEEALGKRGIKFVVRRGSPDDVALDLGENASEIVTDGAYLRPERRWKERVANEADRPVTMVESNVVVPVELASNKREHAARTLRPKLTEYLEDFLVGLNPTKPEKQSQDIEVEGVDLSDTGKLLDGMKLDTGVSAVSHLYRGGESEAKRIFASFLRNRFSDYTDHRNQPQTDDVSHMSKYLHYGHVSPVYLALKARQSSAGRENIDSFVEEVIVRRELSMNFVYYTEDHDSYSCLPDWAKKTLEEHKGDDREYTYTRKQLENAETHDEYWNAAMREMVHTGYMHNYMRMYWGKKILEWSETPEYAYRTTLYLNNKYFVDGRDANSYANIAWVYGNHDRGWTERPVYGKVRYMSAGGLERKAKPDEYVEKVGKLVEEGRAEAL
jgi:deoxyribodipyrimidine photo-lyase